MKNPLLWQGNPYIMYCLFQLEATTVHFSDVRSTSQSCAQETVYISWGWGCATSHQVIRSDEVSTCHSGRSGTEGHRAANSYSSSGNSNCVSITCHVFTFADGPVQRCIWESTQFGHAIKKGVGWLLLVLFIGCHHSCLFVTVKKQTWWVKESLKLFIDILSPPFLSCRTVSCNWHKCEGFVNLIPVCLASMLKCRKMMDCEQV